jgi:hypothetical protein
MPHKQPPPRRAAPTPRALLCLLLVPLTLLLPQAAGGASPHPPPAAYDCEGAACASVTLAWEEEGQRFRADNSSAQRVRVEVETFAGKSSVVVEPQGSAHLSVKTFNGPFRAEFE